MQSSPATASTVKNGEQPAPSPWVRRFAPLFSKEGQILDLACGGGRHSRLLLDAGHKVLAIDRDTSRVQDLKDRCEVIQADLEVPGTEPLAGRRFAGIVVTNYLHRPGLARLLDSLNPGGLLVYETFARGNERFGKPSNPDFLLRPGELLEAVRGKLRVIAYEDLVVEKPRAAALQRIAAIHDMEANSSL